MSHSFRTAKRFSTASRLKFLWRGAFVRCRKAGTLIFVTKTPCEPPVPSGCPGNIRRKGEKMTNRNENSAKPNCKTCHGRGVMRLNVGTGPDGDIIRETECHCVDEHVKKNKPASCEMKLWLLERRKCREWEFLKKVVVRAPDEQTARRLVYHASFRFKGWLTGKDTTCKELTVAGNLGIIASDWVTA